MTRVFICSPLRGKTGFDHEVLRNIEIAKALSRDAAMRGVAPYTPHLLLPRFLDDKSPAERAKGMAIGMEFLLVCDELWFYKHEGISEGMKHEIEFAKELKRIKIVDAWDFPIAVK